MDVIEMTGEFVSHNSDSQLSNAGVSKAIAGRMRQAGMKVERIEYRSPDGTLKVNVVGKKGRGTGGLAMFGHSDVVPAEGWESDPYKLTERGGRLYGRGSADMKGSIACTIAAAAAFPARELKVPVYVVATADEELDCMGARQVAARSKTLRSSRVHYGIIGEPTVLDVVHAHKGSFKVHAVAKGRAAHSSTGRGINANHKMIPFLNEMVRLSERVQTDRAYRDDTFDPPHTTWNIVISDGESASNITAPESRATINARQMPGQSWDSVARKVTALARTHGIKVKIDNELGPLHTAPDSRVVQEALRVTGKRKAKTVPYGTDGMIFGKTMELVVMGPGNIAQAHTTQEWIARDQLLKGAEVFAQMVRRLCIEDPE